jgi:hypothetical protein
MGQWGAFIWIDALSNRLSAPRGLNIINRYTELYGIYGYPEFEVRSLTANETTAWQASNRSMEDGRIIIIQCREGRAVLKNCPSRSVNTDGAAVSVMYRKAW